MGPDLWKRMKQSLTRGNNIEEGHYAERSWLGLLSLPLSGPAEKAVLKAAKGQQKIMHSIGQLSGCDCNRLRPHETLAP